MIILKAAALGLAMLAIAGCTVAPRTTFPPIGSTPGPVGDRTAAARQEVAGALAEVGLQASDTLSPYRPPEGALLAAAPRTVIQASLPEDPGGGFIVIYAFNSPPQAQDAAEDHAAYVASGPGRIQYPPTTRFVLRIVGPTVVSFFWNPESDPDPRTRSIEDALLRIGSGVTVPS